MARTAIQVHAINLIELGQGKMAAHFEPVVDANCGLVAPLPIRPSAIGWYPKVASYDMLGGQLHYSNPVKHGLSFDGRSHMRSVFKTKTIF